MIMFRKLNDYLAYNFDGPFLLMSSSLSTEPSTFQAFLTLSISAVTSSDVGLSCAIWLDEVWSDVVDAADAESTACVSPVEVCDIVSLILVGHYVVAIGSSNTGTDI